MVCLFLFVLFLYQQHQLTEVYGDEYSLQFRANKAVIGNGYKMVKEALVNQAESFADRLSVPVFDGLNKGLSINIFFITDL